MHYTELKKIDTADLVLKKDEDVRWVSVVKKGWRTQKRITVTLSGSGASFQWFILVLGRGNETFPLDITIRHKAPRTVSRVSARCVAYDNAHMTLTGSAVIEKRAVQADSDLAFHARLLSETAHARMIPSLEIKTDDVLAHHAASVDRLTDDTLFYCATRGLEKQEAQEFLARAFLATDIASMPSTHVTRFLKHL